MVMVEPAAGLYRKGYKFILINGKPLIRSGVSELIFQKDADILRAISYVLDWKWFAEKVKQAGIKRVELMLGKLENQPPAILLSKTEKELLQEVSEEIKRNSVFLSDLLLSGRLKIRCVPEMHCKIYLVEKEDRRLVLSGSGNLSEKGLEGSQYENFVASTSAEDYAIYLDWWNRLWKESCPLAVEKVVLSQEPQSGKGIVVSLVQGVAEKVDFLLKQGKGDLVKDALIVAEKVEVMLSKEVELAKAQREILKEITKDGLKNLKALPEKTKTKLQEIAGKLLGHKEENSLEVFQGKVLRWDEVEESLVEAYNGEVKPFGITLESSQLNALLEIVEKFLSFYHIFANPLQAKKGYEVILYAMASPFMWLVKRELYRHYEEKASQIPAFLILGGSADSGKTKLLRIIAILTGGEVMEHSLVSDRGEKTLEWLITSGNLTPLLVDEVKEKLVGSDAVVENLIKKLANSYFELHACLIGGTNMRKDVIIKPEVLKRIYFITFSHSLRKGKDFHARSVKWLKEAGVKDLDDKLFRAFTLLYRDELVKTLREENSLLEFLNDPLWLARKVLGMLYGKAGRKEPEFFPNEYFRDDYYDPLYWTRQYRIGKLVEFTHEGRRYYVPVEGISEEEKQEMSKMASRLPNEVVEKPNPLYLRAELFEEYLNLKPNAWKRVLRLLK